MQPANVPAPVLGTVAPDGRVRTPSSGLPVVPTDSSGDLAILIVDDIAANRLALRLLLRGPGRQILEAASGSDALRILLKEDVSVILLDIEMPDMDGFETADLIRGSSRLQHVPIIFQSAHGSDSRVVQGYGLGAVDFIQKPIVPEILQARVDVFLTLHRNNLELKRTHLLLSQSEARSRAILETATDGVITFDQDGHIEMFNPAAEAMFGYTAAEITGANSAAVLLDVASSAPLLVGDTDLLVGVTREALGRRRDGSTFVVGISVSRVETDGELFFSATLRDLSEAKKVEERLTRLAQYDFLTGLANRVTLEDRIRHALAHSRRYKGNGALMYVDLDRFKQVNDQYGHRIGDLLLQSASRRLEKALRDSDIVARIGGDEFCVLVDHRHDDQAIRMIGERIVTALGEPFMLDDQQISVSASVGIATFKNGAETVTDVQLRADRAMYNAKRLGGNQYQQLDSDIASDSPTFSEEVVQALQTDQFELFYQPIISIPSGKAVDLEVFLRWDRPGIGLVAPKSFLRAAETSGMIIPIGKYLIEHALKHAGAMAHSPAPPGIAINLSLTELADPKLVDYLAHTMVGAQVDPGRVCLEITEDAFFSDWSDAIARANSLRALGVRIALDQFGLSHASMSALTELPCDVVKIDRSLVVSLDSATARSRAIVSAIIDLAHEFDRTVTASGVETQGQYDTLKRLGCDQVQGLLLAEPVPADGVGIWHMGDGRY